MEDDCSFNYYELYAVKSKEVLSYGDVLLSLEREKQTKNLTLRPAEKLGKPTNSNKLWHRLKFCCLIS